MAEMVDEAAEFERLRGGAFAIAYRMTGSAGDAEDLAQEALIRLERARGEGEEIREPRAWLARTTTRLAIDHMRSARVRRETYVGPWLPEPLLVEPAPGPAERAELSDSLSQGFLVLLETLTPLERAVFLLREVFGYGYPEVAAAVGRSEDSCRQLATRARRNLEARRPRFEPDRDHGRELLGRFLDAAASGDTGALEKMLSEDVVLYADGGGEISAARHPVSGRPRIALLMTRVTGPRLERGFRQLRLAVNGEPAGLMVSPEGAVTDVITVEAGPDGRVIAVRTVRNPKKLRHLQAQIEERADDRG